MQMTAQRLTRSALSKRSLYILLRCAGTLLKNRKLTPSLQNTLNLSLLFSSPRCLFLSEVSLTFIKTVGLPEHRLKKNNYRS